MYETTSTGDAELLAFFLSFFLFFAVIGIICYVLFAIGLMNIAKRENIENPWLAWVPVAQAYTVGKIVSHKLGENSGWIVLGLNVLSILASSIPILGALVSIAVAIFMFVVLYWVFEKYSNKAVIMIVFTVLTVGVLGPIFMFAIRNNQSKEAIV
ncbi:hypothetical protein [Bacillus sp. FJAT-47783]|uniref:hypothetical protein n=1 Tax=Bacillus sp. FJAT-47783 TaxID=2922712 RepID=UPI001FAD86C7|nr:hypothetical protein [Bacillus sp. FJAT-47783]